MLRYELGDDVFWKGMRLYYSEYRNRNALTIDFQRAMEKVSNKNLDGFFKQWLFTAGQPDLKITSCPGESKGSSDLVIEQTQDHLFSFNIDLKVDEVNGSHIYKIQVSDRITRKSIGMGKIIDIIPDPDTELLFKTEVDKGKNH